MRKFLAVVTCLLTLSSCIANNTVSATINSQDFSSIDNSLKENEILNKLFTQEQIDGTLVIIDPNKNFLVHNIARANIRYTPASTFKIYNSLIALDTKTLNSTENIFYHYKGEKAYLESWKHDASLQSAIKVSNVLAFKELARRIGKKNMLDGLKRLNYGNQAISKIDTFWLDNSLQISALEQAILINKLAHKELNFNQKAMQDTINIILLEQNADYKLYGKTGFNDNINPAIGLFVGFLSTQKGIYSFALNIDDKQATQLNKRIDLVKQALLALKII